MRIAGIQKLTLLDYPGKLACTLFLSGCNLRCPYCHNAGLVLPQRQTPEITPESVYDFLRNRKGKLDGVCITGGEPTLQNDLPELIQSIRELGFLIKLDTNGSNPQMLSRLLEQGLLDYVAMDIKNSPARYGETCGGKDIFPQAEKSAALLMKGSTDYEFRTTVCRPYHTPEDFTAIGQWLRGAKQYFIQPFVDSGDLVGTGAGALSKEEISALQQAVLPYIPGTRLRGI